MLTDQLLGKLYNLKRDRGSGGEKPYKPALIKPGSLYSAFDPFGLPASLK
ncbi:hypothetical protein J3R74_003972 [Puniceicoccus vermicola]